MGKISLACAVILVVYTTGTLGSVIPKPSSKFVWFPTDNGDGAIPAFLEGIPENRPMADPNNIHFYLFTLNNRENHDVIANTTASLDASHWDKSAPVKIFAHGFSSSHEGGSAGEIRDAFIARGTGENLNLVVINWRSLAAAPWYEVAAKGTELVGHKVAYLLDFLLANGYTTLDKVHVFGHSLGAHVSGWAGSIFQTLRPGSRIPRITGLDPALPLFGAVGDDARLDKTDAVFVDVIHSSAGTLLDGGLAFTEPRGDVDFYPNTGRRQPGCGLDLAGACSHSRCYQFYHESVHSNRFRACKCADNAWETNRFDQCTCSNGEELMGEWTSKSAQGIYYLITNGASPYAQG